MSVGLAEYLALNPGAPFLLPGQVQRGGAAGPSGRAEGVRAALAKLLAWVGELVFKPLNRLIATYLISGRSISALLDEVRRVVVRTLGFLVGRPRAEWLQFLGLGVVDVRRGHLALLAAGACALLTEGVKRAFRYFSPHARMRRALRASMASAPSYAAWEKCAELLDELEGVSDSSPACQAGFGVFDPQLLDTRMRSLRVLHGEDKVDQLVFYLRGDLMRNAGNLNDPRLYHFRRSTPGIVRDYLAEVLRQLDYVVEYSGPLLTLEDKVEFFTEARHAFGRSALILSGGGSLGTFHMGVVKALHSLDALPRVFSGASAGAIVCAIICTRTDEELTETLKHVKEFDLGFFSFKTTAEYFRHLLKKGYAQDEMHIKRRLRALYGDLTFQEAYDRTGRILNVSVCAADTNEPPKLLNYLTAPHVVIWSAVAASSAFPLLFPATDILAKDVKGAFVRWGSSHALAPSTRRWRDGSLELDLPMRDIGVLFNVNHFIVSQTNPHLSPLLNLKRVLHSAVGHTLAEMAEAEVKHRIQQLSMLLPARWAKVTRVMTQAWEGDVTVVIPYSWWSITKLITDMDREEMAFACDTGERLTWEKMPAVQTAVAIERALDRCLTTLQSQGDRAPRSRSRGRLLARPQNGRVGGRIPSWVHLQAMGLAHSKRQMSAEKVSSQEGTGDGWRGISADDSEPASPAHTMVGQEPVDEDKVVEALMRHQAHLWDPLLPGAGDKYDGLSSLDVIAP